MIWFCFNFSPTRNSRLSFGRHRWQVDRLAERMYGFVHSKFNDLIIFEIR
jgi:hypothetical protein